MFTSFSSRSEKSHLEQRKIEHSLAVENPMEFTQFVNINGSHIVCILISNFFILTIFCENDTVKIASISGKISEKKTVYNKIQNFNCIYAGHVAFFALNILQKNRRIV